MFQGENMHMYTVYMYVQIVNVQVYLGRLYTLTIVYVLEEHVLCIIHNCWSLTMMIIMFKNAEIWMFIFKSRKNM